MLRGKATLPLWFEPSHNYVSPAVTEIIYGPVGLIHARFSAVGLFLGRKWKISHEQNVKEFQFYIHMPNFRASRFNNKKKYLKVAYPLKKSRLLFFGCFDLESGRIKLSMPWKDLKKHKYWPLSCLYKVPYSKFDTIFDFILIIIFITLSISWIHITVDKYLQLR